jgi:hypothetical protein
MDLRTFAQCMLLFGTLDSKHGNVHITFGVRVVCSCRMSCCMRTRTISTAPLEELHFVIAEEGRRVITHPMSGHHPGGI